MDNNEHYVNESISVDTIGSRLRAERERLSFSQEAFANKAGVHRRTQVNYESGERYPDAVYLAAIAGLGVDISYVVTGSRVTPVAQPWPDDAQIYASLIDAIRGELLLYQGYDAEWKALFELIKASWGDFLKGGDFSRGVARHCRALLSKSPYAEFDPDRLGELLERIEFVAESEGRLLSARDKAVAILSIRKAGDVVSPPSLTAVKFALQFLGVREK